MTPKAKKPITDAMKLDEVRKEIAFRWRVYTRRVADGKMTKADMDRRLEIMTAIRSDYEARVEGRLF